MAQENPVSAEGYFSGPYGNPSPGLLRTRAIEYALEIARINQDHDGSSADTVVDDASTIFNFLKDGTVPAAKEGTAGS